MQPCHIAAPAFFAMPALSFGVFPVVGQKVVMGVGSLLIARDCLSAGSTLSVMPAQRHYLLSRQTSMAAANYLLHHIVFLFHTVGVVLPKNGSGTTIPLKMIPVCLMKSLSYHKE
ncbi:MAG: hypothetical protein IPH18_18060 [Chitinophagaceae bacterium]|nr:hypothetical protein [Chitinophagaceae bacterium]